eukprot:SAG11_NODE_1575_length_4659_cov_2.048904_7_plen_145_part_00
MVVVLVVVLVVVVLLLLFILAMPMPLCAGFAPTLHPIDGARRWSARPSSSRTLARSRLPTSARWLRRRRRSASRRRSKAPLTRVQLYSWTAAAVYARLLPTPLGLMSPSFSSCAVAQPNTEELAMARCCARVDTRCHDNVPETC